MKNRYWLTLAIAAFFIVLCYKYPNVLYNSLFLLWISVLFHRRFPFNLTEQTSNTARLVTAGGIYLGIITGLFFLIRQFKWFVHESKVVIDFENILHFDKTAYVNIISALLLTIAFFIFSHRMMLDIFRLGLARNGRLTTLAVGLGISFLIVPFFSLSFPSYQVVLIAFVYLILFDLYIDSRTTSLTWLISWLVVFSAFTAFVFYKYNLDRDLAIRLEYAKKLADLNDAEAEAQLNSILSEVRSDDSLNLYFTAPVPFTIDKENIRKRINPRFRQEKYLSAVYDYDVYVLNENFGHSFVEGQNPSIGFNLLNGIRGDAFDALIFAPGNSSPYVYLTKYVFPIPGDTTSFNTVLFCVKPVQTKPTEHQNYKHIENLNDYVFAVYYKDKFVWKNGSILLNDTIKTLLPPDGGWTETLSGLNSNLLYSSLKETTVIIGREVGGFYRPMTLFSFIFSLFIFAVIILSVLNYYLKALPMTQEFPLFWGPSLRNKIQLYIIILMLCSFFAMGLVTTTSFRKSIQPPNTEGIENVVGFNQQNQETNLYRFWENLLNVYVFLLLITAAIGILVANSIADPLVSLVEKLKKTNLRSNEPLKWDSDDEIGELVTAYNKMIGKLEESALKLKQSEREGAWREMAKQVAHEIKNPLTPMKLHLQHLKRVFEADPEQAKPLLDRVANTLVEQIDGLSRIATEFSNFAQMPQTENATFVLNNLLDSVHQLFQKEITTQSQVTLDLCSEKISVFADREQLMRVFNNLIKNAIQAIPEDRSGDILITLNQGEKLAVIKVVDNGNGIPEAMQDLVFQPSFTTKNSGMGLGLAISKNIVEAANGHIYFETKEGEGTTFIVELPTV
jgi:signal transduction histidine kinase